MSKRKSFPEVEAILDHPAPEGFAAVAPELPEVKAAPMRTIIEHAGRIAIAVDGQPVAYYNSKEAALADL